MWSVFKTAVEGFIAHGALSRGAAIAFYVVTSLAPVLLIVVAPASYSARRPCAGTWCSSWVGCSANRAATSSRLC